jgi:hypothetical protein
VPTISLSYPSTQFCGWGTVPLSPRNRKLQRNTVASAVACSSNRQKR